MLWKKRGEQNESQQEYLVRIVFLPVNCSPFHAKTLEQQPLGGTETAIIRLAEALDALGHDVTVISSLSGIPRSKPLYVSFQEATQMGEFDALIIIRGVRSLGLPFKAKKKLFWTGDSYEGFNTYGIGDKRIVASTDGFLAVSAWHAETISSTSGFPLEKTFILRNGIKLEDFAGEEKKVRKRMIYSSGPGRGMEHLPEIFMELKMRHSDAELIIFNTAAVYRAIWPPINLSQGQYEALLVKLRAISGCSVFGAVPQKILAREFMKAAILAYPSHYKETSCITAMEAQAGGCVPVTTALAALPETIGDAGILIEGEPGTKTYTRQYVEACDRLFTDDALFHKLSQTGLERSKDFDWRSRALELIQYLHEKHGLT